MGLVIPLALVRARRNPVRVPQRNLSITQGDAITLELACYKTDSGEPLDLGLSTVQMALFPEPDRGDVGGWGHDYGFTHGRAAGVVWQSVGAVTDALAGLAEIDLPEELTASWCGRYAFVLRIDGAITSRGVLQVLHCPHLRAPTRLTPLTDENGLALTDENGLPLIGVVPNEDLASVVSPPAAARGYGALGHIALRAGTPPAAQGYGALGHIALRAG